MHAASPAVCPTVPTPVPCLRGTRAALPSLCSCAVGPTGPIWGPAVVWGAIGRRCTRLCRAVQWRARHANGQLRWGVLLGITVLVLRAGPLEAAWCWVRAVPIARSLGAQARRRPVLPWGLR
eukprot:686466-Alexandrium_andersonii.AAC.1